MNINVTCVYCKKEWVENENTMVIPPNYELGYSICIECAKTMSIPNTEHSDSFLLNSNDIKDPNELKFFSDMTKRDREKYRGSKCNWCSKESTMRIRRYDTNNPVAPPNIIAACHKHFDKLERLAKILSL